MADKYLIMTNGIFSIKCKDYPKSSSSLRLPLPGHPYLPLNSVA